jgi:carboxymethylenebutenolidase
MTGPGLPATTETLDVALDDGSTVDAILARPSGESRWPGVLLWMDAFGLRPRLEEMAAHVAAHGYVVLVPNLYHRAGRAPVTPPRDLTTDEGRSTAFRELRPLMRSLTPEVVAHDASAYVDALLARPDVTGPLGTVGYCMGGRFAVQAGAARPDAIAAVASFHAGRLATDDDASPHHLVPRLRAEVYVAHADKDASMPPKDQRRLEAALTEAGLVHTTELYEGSAHGFTMSDTAVFDAAATARHWDALLDLLDRTLRSPRTDV